MMRLPERARSRPVGWTGVLLGALLAGASAARADPLSDYLLHCQGCHGTEGLGVDGGAPPFPGQLARLSRTAEGRSYLMRVPGVAQSELDDDHTADLLNWLVQRFDASHAGTSFRPFTGGEVAAHRHAPLVDVAGTRARVLNALPPEVSPAREHGD